MRGRLVEHFLSAADSRDEGRETSKKSRPRRGTKNYQKNYQRLTSDETDLSAAHKLIYVAPRSEGQASYIDLMNRHDLVICAGSAGCGKSLLAVAQAVRSLQQGVVKKIILCRPAVEAGEKLGFLPGGLKEKLDPYMRPLYDALGELLNKDLIQKWIRTDIIEIASVAHLRGRTFKDSFIIIDEAQNLTITQMKMILTRLGEGSRMVVTGDPDQNDLPTGIVSGLSHSMLKLENIKKIGICKLGVLDIVRHPLVEEIVNAYAL